MPSPLLVCLDPLFEAVLADGVEARREKDWLVLEVIYFEATWAVEVLAVLLLGLCHHEIILPFLEH